MTFSILAFDPKSRSLGSAVASCSLAVGGTVTYSRHGVGVVNTQNHAHLSTGQLVLGEMERGRSPQEALDRVLVNAPGCELRQLIATDVRSARGAWTGEGCMDEKRHRLGATCVAAGNTLADAEVVDRMVEAFEGSPEADLGERLLVALEAGQAAGGDRRGRQAAAVRVLPHPDASTAVNLDLRVDDSDDPLRELRRLLGLFRREFG